MFKKFRIQSIKDKKFSNYGYYIIGELFIVIVGILIAIQINDWKKSKIDRKEEKVFLQSLSLEFSDNVRYIEQHIYRLDNNRSYGDSLLFYINNQNKHTEEQFTKAITKFTHKGILSIEHSATKSLLNSGKINLLKNEELKRRISGWESKVTRQQNYDTYHTNHLNNEIRPILENSYSLRNTYVEWQDSVFQNSIGLSLHDFDITNLLKSKEFENTVATRCEILFDNTYSCSLLLNEAKQIKKLIDSSLSKK